MKTNFILVIIFFSKFICFGQYDLNLVVVDMDDPIKPIKDVEVDASTDGAITDENGEALLKVGKTGMIKVYVKDPTLKYSRTEAECPVFPDKHDQRLCKIELSKHEKGAFIVNGEIKNEKKERIPFVEVYLYIKSIDSKPFKYLTKSDGWYEFTISKNFIIDDQRQDYILTFEHPEFKNHQDTGIIHNGRGDNKDFMLKNDYLHFEQKIDPPNSNCKVIGLEDNDFKIRLDTLTGLQKISVAKSCKKDSFELCFAKFGYDSKQQTISIKTLRNELHAYMMKKTSLKESDTDRDGINDLKDNCVNKFGIKKNGCPKGFHYLQTSVYGSIGGAALFYGLQNWNEAKDMYTEYENYTLESEFIEKNSYGFGSRSEAFEKVENNRKKANWSITTGSLFIGGATLIFLLNENKNRIREKEGQNKEKKVQILCKLDIDILQTGIAINF